VELLPAFGARPTKKRVVVDRNRVTGGGVTAGIDFGLRLVAEMAGESFAKGVQLGLEYDPAPPFRCGHPDVAEPEVVAAVRARFEPLVRDRLRAASAHATPAPGEQPVVRAG
jgi:cyclohexyl-isocyanide hydratase